MSSEDISEKHYNLLKLPLIIINSILIIYIVVPIFISIYLLEEHCLIVDSDSDVVYNDSLNENQPSHRYRIYNT